MESNPRKTFEDHWADAFRDASMIPPDQCWENIEKELDKKEDKKPFLMLWRNKGLASGIAAMLLLTLGYVLYRNKAAGDAVKSPVIASKSDKLPSLNAEGEKTTEENTQVSSESIVLSENTMKKSTPAVSSTRIGRVSTEANTAMALSRPPAEENPAVQATEATESLLADNAEKRTDFGNVSVVDGLEFQPFGSRFIFKRNKLSYDLPANTEVLASNDPKGFWMGLNSGVSPFNPNYSVSGFNQDAMMSANKVSNGSFNYLPVGSTGQPSNDFSKPASQPDNSIRRGRAVNIGISMGKKISKRLGIESGFRYLRANSGLQTNVYSVNEQTGDIQAYFQANYLNNSANRANTIISLSENGNQAYDYLSVPMQLSYQIPLIRKLDLQVLGGLSGDLFLRSVLSGSNSGTNTLTAANSTYKPVNISGLGGLRLNYAVSKNWEAVLGSFYQHSLNSGLKSGDHLSFRPKMFGLNYGLNYKF